MRALKARSLNAHAYYICIYVIFPTESLDIHCAPHVHLICILTAATYFIISVFLLLHQQNTGLYAAFQYVRLQCSLCLLCMSPCRRLRIQQQAIQFPCAQILVIIAVAAPCLICARAVLNQPYLTVHFPLETCKIDVSLSAYISQASFTQNEYNAVKNEYLQQKRFIVVSWRQRLTRAQHFVSDFAVRQGYVWEALDVTRRRTHCDQVLCRAIHTYTDSSVANDLHKRQTLGTRFNGENTVPSSIEERYNHSFDMHFGSTTVQSLNRTV